MAGYDDYQTEEEYIAAGKKSAGGEMDTKELKPVAWAANLSSKSETVTALRARLAKMEDALRAIDAKIVELGLAAQRKTNGHKHEKFAAIRHSMRMIVRTALTEEQKP